MAAGTHWTTWPDDPNIRKSVFNNPHIHRPRISSETILQMLTLKSQMLGEKLDILKEAEAFEQRNEY